MAQWLKQSTATTVKMGPFVDSTDGNTEKTALTIAQADIRLTKNGGAFAQTNNAAGATHDEHAYYGVPLDTTDTGTLGRLRVAIHVATALPVWQDFVVVAANIFDSLIGGGDNLDVNVQEWNDATVSAPATAGIPDINVKNINNVAAATPGAAGGLFIAGTNAPVTITGSGNALTLTSTGANGHGLIATGNGSGDGIHGQGGATGDGIEGDGGASGNGAHFLGGATNGAGLRAEAAGSNSAGIKGLGFGSGAGLDTVGGATGPGALHTGGATSGNGITAMATGTVQHGISATGIGTGDGLSVTGGAGADGDGIHATAGGGVDIRGNITGNVTGNLSGSVNSVTLGVTLATAAILAIWNQLTGDAGILANTFGAKLRDWVLGTDNKSLLSTDAQATAYNAIADALLKRDWTAVSGEAARSVLNALRKLRNKVSFDGVNTLTITKENDVNPAFTQTVVEDAAQTPFKSVG